jgi:DNA-binding IclR family transcriptional regulator
MAVAKSGTATKVLEVLTLLGDYPEGATAGDVAEATGHPFSTAYRLVNTLVEAGFATYDARDKRYRLGVRLYQLGQKVAHQRGFDGVAEPILRELTEATGESSVLHVLDGDRSLTACKVDGPQFRTTTDPGDRAPLHTIASGKVLLAFTDPEASKQLLDTIDLTPRTAHPITDREQLRHQIDLVRQQGWAGQSEENDVGMAAIAVPVLSSAGRLIGAVTLAAPIFRASLDGLQAHLPALRQAADRLAAELPARA